MPRPPISLTLLLLIGVGGGLGAIARYGVTLALPSHPWPLATMTTNILGCALMGAIVGLSVERFPKINWLRPLLTTGFCGGFSTLATYTVEAEAMEPLSGIAMSLISIVGSVLACHFTYHRTRRRWA